MLVCDIDLHYLKASWVCAVCVLFSEDKLPITLSNQSTFFFQIVQLFNWPICLLSQAAKEFETELKKEPGEGGDQPPPATPTAVADGEEKRGLEASSSSKESTWGSIQDLLGLYLQPYSGLLELAANSCPFYFDHLAK